MPQNQLLSCAQQTLKRAAWAPLSVLVAHGVIAALFGHSPELDVAMHFLGGAAGAYFLCVAARSSACAGVLGQLTLLGRCLFAFGLTCSAALFWEIAELLSDVFLGTRIQDSVAETMGDLALGAAGALLYLVIEALKHRSSMAPALPTPAGLLD